jgi:hypothetical protein
MYCFGGRPPDMSAFRADTAPHFRRFIPFGRPVAVVLAGDEYAEDQPAPSTNGRGVPSGVSPTSFRRREECDAADLDPKVAT